VLLLLLLVVVVWADENEDEDEDKSEDEDALLDVLVSWSVVLLVDMLEEED